ncbi:MAG: aldolase/citrate lyase family protein [Caldilinea sp.]
MAYPMNLGDIFRFTLFTNAPVLAAEADSAGIDRVGPDLERLGKIERQGGMGRWISDHAEEELPAVFAVLRRASRFVRCNPPHRGLADEIDRLIVHGAQTVMLPHFHTVDEAGNFVRAVNGRARTVLLVETVSAAEKVVQLCRIDGVDEIHFGLNDLSLDLGVNNQFAVLCSTFLEDACAALAARGFPFAVGGVGRAFDVSLPVPSELVYAQYPRLGATGALLSRVFFNGLQEAQLAQEIRKARERLNYWSRQPTSRLLAAREELQARVPICPSVLHVVQ